MLEGGGLTKDPGGRWMLEGDGIVKDAEWEMERLRTQVGDSEAVIASREDVREKGWRGSGIQEMERWGGCGSCRRRWRSCKCWKM